ncbi:10869_t:CDS:1 [Scutellospora calospora]|uniref:10869_t:CDS:1 n=1 Tax=Scutellospora calospora TaxID=85575 RepID=A0ACA9LFA7_9GLOM|nr:10869_t:CDS:1 [Scutellospora calospora]
MYYEQAKILFEQKKYDKAFSLFSISMNSDSYFYLGLCYEYKLGVSRYDFWTSRNFYEQCIQDNSTFKYRAALHYACMNLKMYKRLNDQINNFFTKENEYMYKYFIGYAFINGEFGATVDIDLGEKYLKEINCYEINHDDIHYLYNLYYKEFGDFFNLIKWKKKINIDLIDYYFDIAISGNMKVGNIPIDEYYKQQFYEIYL